MDSERPANAVDSLATSTDASRRLLLENYDSERPAVGRWFRKTVFTHHMARVTLALAVGLVCWVFLVLKARADGPGAWVSDFTIHWLAADAFRHGYSPYRVINAWSNQYSFNVGYVYWLPTAVILSPFAWLPMQVAMRLFSALSAAVFTYAITRDGWWRLPFLASLPFVWCVAAGQTVPLVTAAIFLPALGWLAPIKYTTAAAGAAFNLSRVYVFSAAAVVVVSVILWPSWPREWWVDLHEGVGPPNWHIPIRVAGGVVLLAALTKWRRPEARFLAVMACVPQTMLYYDQLPLLVVARTYRQALALSVASWVAPIVFVSLHPGGPFPRTTLFAYTAPVIVWCYYIPCLVLILFRPNKSA